MSHNIEIFFNIYIEDANFIPAIKKYSSGENILQSRFSCKQILSMAYHGPQTYFEVITSINVK